jgi:multiple sugar transport system substrate-binding protein
MKRIVLCFLIGFTFSAMLFAGGGQQQSGGAASQGAQTTVIFWDENPGPDRTPYLEEIIKWYHESQNNYRVSYVGVPQAQFAEKLNVAIAGNAVPDIGGMQPGWLSGLIAQNAVLKLDDIFNSWEESKQFDPASINATRLRDINRGLYLLPVRATYPCIWYRIDRFREAGLQPPQTWDDLFNDIARLTNTSQGQYGWALRGGPGSADQLQTLLFAYSGQKEYISRDGIAAFRDPLMLEFLARFAGIYNKNTAAGDVNNNYQAMVAAFDSGAANMMQHNLGSLGEHKKALPEGSFGTIFFPKSLKGYNAITLPGYNGYSIFSSGKNNNGGVDFLKFLCSARVISYWNEKIGEFPPRYDVQEYTWVKNADHLKNIVPAMQSPDTVYIELPQYLPEYNRIMTELAEPGFQAVLLGQTRPADFLNQWADAVEQAYKRYIAATGK